MRSTIGRASSIIAATLLLLLASCSQKKTHVPFVIPQTPTAVVTGDTTIFFETYARSGQAVNVAFEISTDDGAHYVPCTPVGGGSPNRVVIADPFGAPSAFEWDSFADIGPGVFPKCVIRATGFADGTTGRQAASAPFPANESGSFTLPRGTTGTARSGALATPLPDGAVLLAGGLTGSQPSALVEVYDPSTEQVNAALSLSRPRTNLAGALLTSGRVLVAGGSDLTAAAVDEAELFSRATNAVTTIPGGLVVARTDAAIGALPGGFAVVAGGATLGGAPVAEVELYDPNAGVEGSFSIVTSGTLAAVRLPTATALPDGRVLFAGGAGPNGQAVTTTFLYDPTTRTISQGGNMTQGRVGHRATRLSSGKVFIAGGRSQLGDPASATTTAELFDPATNGFATMPPMSRARAFHGQDLAGGRVVAVGGSSPAGDTGGLGEVFDLDTSAWSPLPFKPGFARSDATLVASGPGRALLAGGSAPPELYHPLDAVRTITPGTPIFPQPIPTPPGTNPTTLPPSIVPIFAPFVSEAWIALRAPAKGRAYHTATRTLNGAVLLVGGTSGVDTATTSVELFEVAPLFTGSDTLTKRASLSIARSHHAAGTGLSGEVVVFGGLGANGAVLGSVERYDFFSDTWVTIGATLARPRYDHHAVQLQTGDVLIVGGRDAAGVPVGLAELYHPFTDTLETVGSEITPRADDDILLAPNGQFLVVGGRDATGALVKSIEVYDVLGRSFSAGGLLLEGRAGLTLTPSADFRALIAAGGEGGTPGGAALADYEGIDSSTGVPVPVAGGPQPLDSPRAFHRASVYADRIVLFEGGESNRLPLDTSTLYVPISDGFNFPTAFQAVVRPPLNPRMNMPRLGFTATPLDDGRILVAGGVDHRGVVVPGLEVFVR